jgi:phosphoglycerate dehydrogenase-like enzyme
MLKEAMKSTIIVHPVFDGTWPFVADYLRQLWTQSDFVRLAPHETRTLEQLVPEAETVTRLISLMAPLSATGLENFTALREAVLYTNPYGQQPSQACLEVLKRNKVNLYRHDSEGYWGQSVAEFALALTLCALRQIPQGYHKMMTSLEPWNYEPANGIGEAGKRGVQYCDDPNFSSGTLQGKRVRIVGAGNIGSRYASFCHFMGADVATWDPFASEPSFHRAGARRVRSLEQLFEDAEIFAPMLPLTPTTQGLITANHLRALPKGCLVILVTRALICDFATLKTRVLNNELSLAADVFDVEPVPLDDPLLGRNNVVHTPHMAGRTKEANFSFAKALADMFLP